ncbi:MAG: glycosyltransferase family 25 protein [Thermoguttaceae bacterium]|nr:glycosyltransferase family 25 protein [Planctomycetaceae bacterium]MBQ4143990.1 glycosyltransferase family 25 protein [Thermoguttaceae bacterium]
MEREKTLICCVINLDRSPERWEKIQTNFSQIPLTVRRIPGIEVRSLEEPMPIRFFPLSFALHAGRGAVPGEIGCYASHMKAMEEFLATDHDFCLICEDDVVPSADLMNVLCECLNVSGWDLLRAAKCREKGFHVWRKLPCGTAIGTNVTGFAYAAAYVVSRKGAESLLKNLMPMRLPYDLALHRGWLNVREASLMPCPISLDPMSEVSEIGTKRKIRSPLLGIARNVLQVGMRIRRYAVQTLRILQRRRSKNGT